MIMKRTVILLFLLVFAALSASAQSFSAQLIGANEVPVADPDGSGFAVVTISGTTVSYTVFAQGIGTPTLAHIHRGAAGATGSPVIDFNVNTLTNGSVTGVAQSLVNEILANPSGFYVNVHTAEFPNGAIRGQLVGSSSGQGTRTSYIPVVGKVAGANNTNFVTDFRVVNNGGGIATVKLDYFASNPAGLATPTASQTITVAPGEQKVLNDLVGVTLAQSGGLGALKITSDENVVASARVINDLRTQNLGTAGFALNASEAGSTSGTILFLAQSADYRTNLGYFNATVSQATLTLTARGADGTILGTNAITIPAGSMVQQPAFSAISAVPEAGRAQNDFYVTWTSNVPLFVYGAVTDSKTGDAVLSQ
jgi:hypothetical protein